MRAIDRAMDRLELTLFRMSMSKGPGDEPVTRSLTPEMVSFYGYDALSWYAVTASNLLEK